LEETPWGKELKEFWTSEGRKEGLAEGQKEGRQKGITEGRKEGITEGRKEGIAEGRKEGLLAGRAEELRQQLTTFVEMFTAGELPEPAYQRLKTQAENELANIEAEQARLGARKTEPIEP
jgi:hypothetical protein